MTTSWRQTLLLSGLSLGIERLAGDAVHAGGPLGFALGAGAVAAGAVGHFLVHVAHGQREKHEAGERAARNHLIRRGMMEALRSALQRSPKPAGELYEALGKQWDESLGDAIEDNAALERLFPAEVFDESQWAATNSYSPDTKRDAGDLAAVLHEWLLKSDSALYQRWNKDEALKFAEALLPFYRQAFAEALNQPSSAVYQAFVVKGISELRGFADRAWPLLKQIAEEQRSIRAEQRMNHGEVMAAFAETMRRLAARPGAAPAVPRFAGNVPSRLNRPFVGRTRDLDATDPEGIEAKLGPASEACALVLHGEPGTGKSELAREYARLRKERYPGGTFLIHAETIDVDFAGIGKHVLGLSFPADLAVHDQAKRTFYRLGKEPALVIYDNAASAESLQEWLPAVGMLCHVLITTFVGEWPSEFRRHRVDALSPDESRRLIETLAGGAARGAVGRELAAFAGGLPVEICPMAAALAKLQERGRARDMRLYLAPEAKGSFAAPYELLGPGARLALHAAAFMSARAIPRDELVIPLRQAAGCDEEQALKHLDDCIDLHMLEGAEELTMHQLRAAFLRDVEGNFEAPDALRRVREAQRERWIGLAGSVAEKPADSDRARRFMLFPVSPEAWEEAGLGLPAPDGTVAGRALAEIGRFEEARGWFERAVAAAEKGDVHGRIDHESLGTSLHQVGYCLSSLGRFEEARGWFGRAVAEEEKGDVHGRIDHASLGSSLHQVGYCLSSLGQFEEAQGWFERAVAEAEKGDVHGRMDHASLGTSLHEVGYCLSSRADSRRRGAGLSAPWRKRATYTGASTTRAWAGACIKWATAFRAWGDSRRRGAGLSAPWRRKKRATYTGASTTRAWARACI